MIPKPYSGSLVVYHVTPAENTWSILQVGVDPARATGKMKASWYVGKQHIEWAMIHVSVSHHVYLDDLAVCACLVDYDKLHKFIKPGFYFTYETLEPESVTPAMFFLHAEPKF